MAVGGAAEDAVGVEAVVGQRGSGDAFQTDREDALSARRPGPGVRMRAPGTSLKTPRASAANSAPCCWMAGKAQLLQQLDRGAPGGVERVRPRAEFVALGVIVQAGLARREAVLGCRAGPAAPGMQALLGIAPDVHGADAVGTHAPLEGGGTP